ncbi:MAG: hemolysin family protein [Pseudomonadota bacterium]
MLLFVSAVAVVLIVSFLCSIFESVLLSITRPQIEVLNQQGRRAGSLLAGFKENMDVPIAAILILNTAAHTVGAAVAGASYSAVFDPSTLWIFSLLFTLAVLLFTEIIPKTLGVSYAQSLASPVAHGIHYLSIMLKPLVVMSELLSRQLRADKEAPVTSADEIRLLAVLGQSEGAVGDTTAGLIVGATHLKDLNAGAVMLPRDSVEFLSKTMSRDAVIERLHKSGHSRFPLSASASLDDATEVVLAKNLLHWLLTHDDESVDWDALAGEALIVPSSMTLPKLLRTFQDARKHLALVVGEYGNVEGLVTMEDVLEEVVGDIDDEKDTPSSDFRELENGALLARASVDLRKLCAKLGVAWNPDWDVSTVSGLLIEQLERIPVGGDTLDWHGHRIRVLRADRRRVRLVSIAPIPDDEHREE